MKLCAIVMVVAVFYGAVFSATEAEDFVEDVEGKRGCPGYL